MPIYEYLCSSCNIIYQFLVRNPSRNTAFKCPKCAGTDMKRVMSSFAVAGKDRSSKGGLADDPSPADINGEDPGAMARTIRRMAEEMGEDLGCEVEEALSRLEAGEDPEKIERELEESGFTAPDAAPAHDPGLYEV